MADSLRPMNIRVNGLVLGLINTTFSEKIRMTPEIHLKLASFGIYRLGKPEECSGIVSFLCSEDASYINGENIGVTGGTVGRL
ncbi:dehydrogenase reductase SDR family member 4 isoform X2 [Pelobates cultripes]|uniref:Dehydrogenase reductase SDR family member 4 isoform X2 n=1 Tax=Pelobates cultripes TaxID=61616 RepID=A0AAD1S9S8_PELCU|nr:dehydrogenase reductase SDR family member 4 isoform X2 [Pelobates cultripes]